MTIPTPLWAHSPNVNCDWHRLDDHLRATAGLARRFAASFGGGEVAYWLGRLHDVGKAGDWQQSLCAVAASGGTVGVDHKSLGTRLAIDIGLGGFAGAVFGHHGGLVDTPVLNQLLQARIAKYSGAIASAERVLPHLVPDLPEDLASAIPPRWLADPLVGEVAARLCFSALVDADYLDTSAHFQGRAAARVREPVDFQVLHQRFEQRRAHLIAQRRASPVDGLREALYRDCLSGAERPRGIFRLPAPTGSGKTLTAGGFALRHAAVHGMSRVVVAVPFLTITEQNAEVYRQHLDGPVVEPGDDEPVVLEHHSQADFDDATLSGRWGRLAAENWDAPFVVTTFVRLFESLFARRPAAMRRLHRLAGAVIVLDEVQALPHELLVPILDALGVLVTHFGASVLLASATQPDFWAPELGGSRALPVNDLVAEPRRLFTALRRVRYEWRVAPRPTLVSIADEAAAGGSAMVVVNTTTDAKTVYERWKESDVDGQVCHLSARMCPEHRRRVLTTVRSDLAEGRRVLLVATQLIEAGVDVDFPVVFRAMAPADSLLQAGGRANREGTLPGLGRVVIFAPEDGGQPPSYRLLVTNTQEHFGPDRADPDDRKRLSAYYRAVYRDLNLADSHHLGQRIQRARARWEFQTVADGPPLTDGAGRDHRLAFRLIRDEGIAVVTPQGAACKDERRAVERLVERIRAAAVPDRRDLRRLQPFTTNLHPSVLRTAGVLAMLRPVRGQVPLRGGSLAEWAGPYHPATGIDVDPRVEEFVV